MRVRLELHHGLALGCVVYSNGCVAGVVCVCCGGTSCVLGATTASVVGGCSVRGESPLISVLINGMVSGCVVNTIRGCSSVGVGAAEVRPDDEGRGGSGGGYAMSGCHLNSPPNFSRGSPGNAVDCQCVTSTFPKSLPLPLLPRVTTERRVRSPVGCKRENKGGERGPLFRVSYRRVFSVRGVPGFVPAAPRSSGALI